MGEQCHFGVRKKIKKKTLQISFFINLVAIRHLVLLKLNGLASLMLWFSKNVWQQIMRVVFDMKVGGIKWVGRQVREFCWFEKQVELMVWMLGEFGPKRWGCGRLAALKRLGPLMLHTCISLFFATFRSVMLGSFWCGSGCQRVVCWGKWWQEEIERQPVEILSCVLVKEMRLLIYTNFYF